MRETDARVPRGTFNDGPAGFYQTLFFGLLDEVEGSAVLDGTAGVHELGFAVDVAAGLVAEFVEPY